MYYVLHGEDEFTRSEAVAGLKSQIVKDGMGDLNITVLDGKNLDVQALINACNTIPFLTQRRMVVVQDFLQRHQPRGGRKRAKSLAAEGRDGEQSRQLLDYLPNLPPSTRLVFVESGSLKRGHPVLKAAESDEQGYIREFKIPQGSELRSWVRARAKAKSVDIRPRAIQVLIQFIGQNLRAIDGELEKLAAYANYERPITMQDVEQLVGARYEADIFDLVDNLGLRKRERAMHLLQGLLGSGASELYVLAMIARQVRLILAAKDLAENRGASAPEIRRALHISHRFIVDKLLLQSKNFTIDELQRIQEGVLETDQAIKTGGIDARLGLELLVVGICNR